MKSYLLSKTLWFNVLFGLGLLLSSTDVLVVFPKDYLVKIGGAVAAINIVLRMMTNRPVSFTLPANTPTMLPLFLGLGLTLLPGCAHPPVVNAPQAKLNAINYLQASETATGLAQDGEIALCAPVAPKLNHCTAAPALLTDAQHQAFSRAIGRALRAEKKFHDALQKWDPAQPAPLDLETLKKDITDAGDIIRAVLPTPAEGAPPSGVQRVLANIIEALDKLASLKQLLAAG